MTIVAGTAKTDAARDAVHTHPNMDFKRIQCFIAPFEEDSVTRTVKRMNAVQPALSMQIAKLEDEFGQGLFERILHGVVPTVAGRMVYRLFLSIVRNLASARQQMMQREEHMAGHITIGMVAFETESVLIEALARSNADYPDIGVSAADSFSTALVNLISADQPDAAVVHHQHGRLALQVQPLYDEGMVLMTGAVNGPGLPESVEMAKLPGLELVLPTESHGLYVVLDTAMQIHDVTLVSKFEIDIPGTIVWLVEATCFATALPYIVVQYAVEEGRLHMYTIAAPCTVRYLVCVSHPRRPLSTATETLIAVVAEEIKHVLGMAQCSGGRCATYSVAGAYSGRNGTSQAMCSVASAGGKAAGSVSTTERQDRDVVQMRRRQEVLTFASHD